jgi:hypothetical protein
MRMRSRGGIPTRFPAVYRRSILDVELRSAGIDAACELYRKGRELL